MILRLPALPRSLQLLASLAFATVAIAQSSTPLSVTTHAGQAGQRQATNGTGAAARFYAPSGMVVRNGNLIVIDSVNNFIRQITPAGAVTTFAGQPIDLDTRPVNTGSSDGAAENASFNFGSSASTGGPWGNPIFTIVGSFTLGLDGSGNIYLADTLNNTIRKITPAGIVSTLAGQAGEQGSVDGTGSAARFRAPGGVAADSAGNVYVADTGNYTIRKITPAGVVTTLAGLSRTSGTTDGTGTAALFDNPAGIAIDSSGTLFVADTGNHTIRKVTQGGVVTTFAGIPRSSGSSDGALRHARFNSPTGIAVDGVGNVYVTDVGSHTVRAITSAGRVSTVAGSAGTKASIDGIGNVVRFNEPSGITVDSGIVYIADTQNNTIRRATLAGGTQPVVTITQQPVRRYVNVGRNTTLTVVANATPAPTYQWYRDGAAISGATSSNYTISNAQNSSAGIYTVVVTSGNVSLTSAAAEVSVFPAGANIPPVIIFAHPEDTTVRAGASATLTVEAATEATATYQWSKNNSPISGATSPSYVINSATASDAGEYMVTITDGSFVVRSNNAILTVDSSGSPLSAPSITTQPGTQTINVGGTATFTVAANGNPTPIFQWRRDGSPIFNGTTTSGSVISGATTDTLRITGATTADAGVYTAAASNSVGSAVSANATLTVDTPVVTASRIINLSILSSIGTSEEERTFTMGYVVGGEGTTGAKPLVIRVAGPSLSRLGVTGFLPDPKLELLASQTVTASNDNWGGSQALTDAMGAVGAFPFIDGNTRDAAITANITTRDNQVRVSSAAVGGTGQVLAEVYDATPSNAITPSTPRLINVSLLKNIGESVSAGFVIRGPSPKRVLIRAIGPTLGSLFGMGGVVPNPRLTVFASGGVEIGANDNWGGTAELTNAFNASGAFGLPAASQDAAIVMNLNPGDYSVTVRPVGATGQALVEIYELP